MNDLIFSYKDKIYPDYLRDGNACRFIIPMAKHFCNGMGVDVGASEWPLPGAIPVDLAIGRDASDIPVNLDYIFSSHCLEHIDDPIDILEYWKTRLKAGGVLFLYLPHPDMEYWLPQNCRKHLHSWQPEEMAKIIKDLGYVDVMYSERDFAWGYTVVGFNEKQD